MLISSGFVPDMLYLILRVRTQCFVGKFVCDNLMCGFKPKNVVTNVRPRSLAAFALFA